MAGSSVLMLVSPYDQIYQQFTTNLTAQLDEALDSNITHLRELQQQQKQADIERAKLQLEILKQAREVKAMEQRFTRLTNISPVAINIARLDGSILYVRHSYGPLPCLGVSSSLQLVILLT